MFVLCFSISVYFQGVVDFFSSNFLGVSIVKGPPPFYATTLRHAPRREREKARGEESDGGALHKTETIANL